MTPADAYRVLAKILAYDRRRGAVDDTDAVVWAEGLSGCELADCLEAVTEHYQTASEMAMVADIRQRALAIARRRAGRARLAELAAATAPDGTPLAITDSPASEPGRTPGTMPAELRAILDQITNRLPAVTPHDLARQRARRERGRPPSELTQRRRQQPDGKRERQPDHPDPASAEIAAMARRYLLDGHDPQQVADRLGVSRKWCRRTAAGMDINPTRSARRLARELHEQITGVTEQEPTDV